MTAPIDLEEPRPAGGRRLQAALMAACLTLLSAGIAGVVVVGNEAASPAEDLARLQAFVEEARTARFTSDEHTLESSGEGDVGSDYSSRSKVVGALQVPDRSQWTVDTGEGAFEGIVVPGAVYFREAATVVELADEQWTYEEVPADAQAPVGGEMMMMAAGVGTAFGATDLVDMLAATRAPQRVDDRTIEAEVDVRRMPGFDPEQYVHPETDERLPLPEVTIRLTSGPDHRLERMVVRVEEELDPSAWGEPDEPGLPTSFTATSDTRFTDWGAPQSITAPAAAAVDPTPYVDEDGLGAFRTMPLFGLRTLPGGFELLMAEVFTAPEDADDESGDCPEVDLSYGNPGEHDAAEAAAMESGDWDAAPPPSIEVELTPADCDYWGALTEDDSEPIRVGGRTGRIRRGEDPDEDYGATIEVIVGATRVTVMSDLPEAQTIAAAGDLVPLDLGTQPVHHVTPPG